MKRSRGFTLVETLVILAIVSVLALVTFRLSATMREKSQRVVCMGKMRQIGGGMLARAIENNGRMYTKEEIGNSMYREFRDPLSLCQVLEEYAGGESTWMSPGAPRRIVKFKNAYAWSVAGTITQKPLSELANPEKTTVLWNNFQFTLPSVFNVPEPATKAGPRTPSPASKYRIYPWSEGAHRLYLDLHIETY